MEWSSKGHLNISMGYIKTMAEIMLIKFSTTKAMDNVNNECGNLTKKTPFLSILQPCLHNRPRTKFTRNQTENSNATTNEVAAKTLKNIKAKIKIPANDCD